MATDSTDQRAFTAPRDSELHTATAADKQARDEAQEKAERRRRLADISHDVATEGYARRPFRTNPHD